MTGKQTERDVKVKESRQVGHQAVIMYSDWEISRCLRSLFKACRDTQDCKMYTHIDSVAEKTQRCADTQSWGWAKTQTKQMGKQTRKYKRQVHRKYNKNNE